MRTLINNVKLVTGEGVFDNAAVLINGGKIEFVSTDGAMILPAVHETVDGGGCYLGAGFIDIHVHGGGGHDFMDGTEEAFRPHPTDPLKSRTALQNLTIQQDLRKYGVATDFFCQIGGGHNEASWEKQIPRFMHFLWQ